MSWVVGAVGLFLVADAAEDTSRDVIGRLIGAVVGAALIAGAAAVELGLIWRETRHDERHRTDHI